MKVAFNETIETDTEPNVYKYVLRIVQSACMFLLKQISRFYMNWDNKHLIFVACYN